MRAPPDLAALHALHGAFFDIYVQSCVCSSAHQGRALAAARWRRSRRFFAVRKDARRIGGAGAMPTGASFSCSGSRLAGACRLPFTGLWCCDLMRRGGVPLRQPGAAPRRRARPCDTRSRRPQGCRALLCARCCATCMWRGRVGGMPCMRGRWVGAGCALRGLARAAPRGSLSPACFAVLGRAGKLWFLPVDPG